LPFWSGDDREALMLRQRRVLAAISALLWSLSDPSGAAADDAPRAPGKRFALSWVRLPGAESCIAPADLARHVEARLKRPAFGALSRSEIAIEGYVARDESGRFRVAVSMTDEHGRTSGSRELRSESDACSELDSAVVLTLALLIDPNADLADASVPSRARATKRPKPPAKPPEQPAPAQPASEPPRARRPAASSSVSHVASGVAWVVGNLPESALGIWFRGALGMPRWGAFEWTAAHVPEQVAETDAGSIASSQASLTGVFCPLAERARPIGYAACAGVEGGVITLAGVGRSGLLHERRPIVNAVLAAHGDVRLIERLALTVGAAAHLPMLRYSITYRQSDDRVHELESGAVIGVSAGAGLLVHFR
jgi:hypothetical protein